jgi:hypothetical protein
MLVESRCAARSQVGKKTKAKIQDGGSTDRAVLSGIDSEVNVNGNRAALWMGECQ